MAHDGSSRLIEFSAVNNPLGDDFSVGDLSLTTLHDTHKPLAAGGFHTGQSVAWLDASINGFDFSTLPSIESIAAAGHVEAITASFELPQNLGSPSTAHDVGLGNGPDVLGAPGAAGSLQTLANYLTDGFWGDRGASARWFNMTSSGTGANFGTLFYNVTGWTGTLATAYGLESDSDGISAARQTMVREAFKLYSAVLGINFVETTSTSTSVDFFFKDSAAGTAYEAEQLYSGSGGAMDYAVINVAAAWSGSSSNIGGTNGYTFQTFIHEIGHALGLGHQGLYNAGSGSPTYANSAIWANDSWTQTMMSYWDQVENTEFSNDSHAQLVSPMSVDWIALNHLYAAQGYGTTNAFTGNTIWGFGTNITTTTSTAFANLATYAATNAFTIVDGGGIDTVNFSNYAVDQTINLYLYSTGDTHAGLSSVGGLVDNMTIAIGSVIENATTGAGNDVIFGNTVDNILTGNDGNDAIYGYGGDDTEYGGNGTDTLYGGDGNDYLNALGSSSNTSSDQVYGGAGNDYIISGLGTETLDGGTGIDTLVESVFNGNYMLDLGTGLTNYGGESHTGFEIVFMGSGDDSVTGVTSQADTIYGGDGNDTISSGASTAGDVAYGGDGNDSLVSGIGNESMYGGAGIDVIDQRARNGTYVFDMGTGLTNFTGELFTGFEIAYIGNGNDSVTGVNSQADTIYGGGGDDTINAGTFTAGDVVYGGAGNDSILSGLGNESMYGDTGIDTIDHRAFNGDYAYSFATGLTNYGGELYTGFEVVFMGDGNDTVTGSAGDETIYGGLGDDHLDGGLGGFGDRVYGGEGNDTIVASTGPGVLDGGNGIDLIDMQAIGTDQVFNMITGTTSTAGQSFTGFEDVFMGAGNDVIFGSGASNTIYGGDGNDTIYGGGNGFGGDALHGGNGNDLFTYVSGEGYDNIYGDGGTDTVVFQPFAGDGLLINLAAGTFGVTGQSGVFDFVSVERVTTSTGNDIVTGNNAKNVIILGDGDDVSYGGGGNDKLTGAAGNDLLYGGGNDDSLYGGDGNDLVTGGSGNDLLIGGAGDDTLTDSAGNDVLTGGSGSDHFVFSGNFGVDKITDFAHNGITDVIDLTAVAGLIDFADLVVNHLTQSSANAVITVGANTLTLIGVMANTLHTDDFLI